MLREMITKHAAASVVLAAMAAAMSACAPTEEQKMTTEMLPPAPANATASCVYQLVSSDPIFRDPDLPTSTMWLDAGGQVIRVDGWRFADTSPYGEVPAAYDLTWDADGRLVRLEGKQGGVQLVYSADEVLEMYPGGDIMTHHLVDGRDVRDEQPADPKTNRRTFTTQTYDAAGRLSSQNTGFTDLLGMVDQVTNTAEFTYDTKGRIATFKSTSIPASDFAPNLGFYYIETANRLVVNIIDRHEPQTPSLVQIWIFDFDANHRLVRDTVDDNGDGYDDFWDEFRYLEGEIEVGTHAPGFEGTMRATGPCAAPSVVLAPAAPLPFQIRRIAQYRSLPNEAAAALAELGAAGSLISYPQ
jgi:YD repeat-containing protein